MKKAIRAAATLLCMAFLLTGCGQAAVQDIPSLREQNIASDNGDSAVSTEEAIDADITVDATAEYTATVFAMDTYMDMKAYGPGAEAAIADITDEILSLEAMLSVTAKNSEIYAVNHAAGEAVPVSDRTRTLMERAVALGDTTGNALDISIYPVLTAWGFTTSAYQVPSDDTISALLRNVDDNRISFDDEAGTVTVPEGMEVDLGSVVKGYTGDCAAELLKSHGVTSALLNLGGSTIRTLGAKPDGSDWKVAIQDPNDTAGYAGILAVTDCAVDTSGGYERFFLDEDGNVYWHILDPATGYPARSGLISATIISADSFRGDGLSTAAFVMGLEKTIAYWRENGCFEFVLISEAGEIYVSEGIAEKFTPYGSYEEREIHVVPFEDDSQERTGGS